MLRNCSRWLFFGALLIAPWLYGGTTATSIVVINWILAASFLFWLVECLLNRRKPEIPVPLILICAALCLIGAWMTFNGNAIYDPEFGTFARTTSFAASLPGSVDYILSAAWMVRGALLLLSILFIVDLSQNDKALLQLWSVIAISVGSIALLGLLQKASGAQAIFWQAPIGYTGGNFFGTYYYHANAGAFLNLGLPLTAGLAARAFGTATKPATRALWLMMFLLNLAAIAANTSRMAQAIGLLILIALVWQLGPRIFRRLSGSEKNVALAGAAAIFLMIYAIAATTHLERPLQRWEKLGEQISVDARWTAARIAFKALPDAGALGFGPSTFRAAFPIYQRHENPPLPGQWRFLHQDYLQTVMEWGWLGSLCWAALFVGGIAVALRSLSAQRALRRSQRSAISGSQSVASSKLQATSSQLQQEWSWRRRLILPLAIIALLGAALHSAVDFPLQIESIQLFAATYLGLCWSSAGWRAARRSS